MIFVSSFNGAFYINNTQIGNHSGMFEKSMRDLFFSSNVVVVANSTNITSNATRANITANSSANASASLNISAPVTALTSFNQIFVSNSDLGIGQLNSLIAIDDSNSIVKSITLENLEIRNITFR